MKQPTLKQQSIRGEQGFTIVELMIATLVFSVILLVITVGVLRFSSAYYKGVNNSNTQSVARSITDTVSQAVQFGSTSVTPSSTPGLYDAAGLKGVFCAGGYTFVYSQKQYTGGTPDVNNPGFFMMRMPTANCGTVSALDTQEGQELLGKGMRVTNVSLLAGTNDVYTFSVTVAYGENDLLCITASNGCAQGSSVPTDSQLVAAGSGISCRSGTGNEYCSVVTLDTSIKKRVGN